MQKVLIVTYYWPPGSGAGVQRWLKFSRYLPQYGWDPFILTVDPQYAAYPAIDNSMTSEVPGNLIVYKTKANDFFRYYKKDKSRIPSSGFASDEEKGFKSLITRLIRGNFFIPDPRRGWNRYAFKKACEIIESRKINHIITTSPPHSTQLIGLKLKRKYPAIKWIADLRDPWTDIYYYKEFYPTWLSNFIDSSYEKSVLQSADRIITVGKSLKELFCSKIQSPESKFEVITNGFDEEDFTGLVSSKPGIFTISYIGTLSDSYPLTGFLNALKVFGGNGRNFRLKFVGTVSPKQKETILSSSAGSKTEFVKYASHSTAIRYMLDSSALLLIIPDHRSSRSIITGKLFEYIASGSPIICIGPASGDAAEIIANHAAGKTFHYSEEGPINDYLNFIADNPGQKPVKVSELSRKILTGRLAGVLNL
jgi:glycosyltransferase involved in cell wall biosynthesis